VQAKLLRVVEDGAVTPVGGREPKMVTLRFVCATNRDLREAMAGGHFRADLYFRLSGTVLRVPPLRERPSENEPLARLLLGRAARAAGCRSVPRLTVQALDRLLQYPWPGNVRELRNVIGRALLVCQSDEIGPEHLFAGCAPTVRDLTKHRLKEDGSVAAPEVARQAG
jgi:two-component system, NtrC family, response regulator AtoC